jgi:hypothetical protein
MLRKSPADLPDIHLRVYPVAWMLDHVKHCPQAPKVKFASAEDRLLSNAVRMFGCANWHRIANLIPGRSARQCRERWTNYLNPDLFNGEWTADDDRMLLARYDEIGPKWVVIAQFFPGRSKNSVRNRLLQLRRRERMGKVSISQAKTDERDHDPLAFMDAVLDDGALTWTWSGKQRDGEDEFSAWLCSPR